MTEDVSSSSANMASQPPHFLSVSLPTPYMLASNSAAKRLSCLPTYEGKSNAHSVYAHYSLFTMTHTGGSHYNLSAVIQ